MGAYAEHAEKAQRKCPKQEPSAPVSPPLRPFTTIDTEYKLLISLIIVNGVVKHQTTMEYIP